MDMFHAPFAESLDLGFFSFFAKIFFTLLRFIHSFVGNWGLSIILLTLALKFLLYPATKGPQEMAEKMKLMQPELERAKAEFADNPQKMALAQASLFKKYKINPAAGCLPIFIQAPIFIGFFTILRTSVDLRHVPFGFWIQDLSAPDPYFILPLLNLAVQYIQQKVLPVPNSNKETESIMKMMPIMFSVFMIFFPAGVALYMVTQTITTFIQQYWSKHKPKKS
jgi:YidC/Oxa1 family membrane protein insertase